jgi:hypothetical protein
MEVSGQLHTLAALPLRENPRYPLDRRLGGVHSQFGCSGEEKKSYHCNRELTVNDKFGIMWK